MNTEPERLYEWQLKIGQWADLVFPNRTTTSCFLKLYEECGEYLRNPADGHELADILIMVIDLANLNGIDIQKALLEKHIINENRTWKVNSLTGTMSHVDVKLPASGEVRLLDDPEGEGSLV